MYPEDSNESHNFEQGGVTLGLLKAGSYYYDLDFILALKDFGPPAKPVARWKWLKIHGT